MLHTEASKQCSSIWHKVLARSVAADRFNSEFQNCRHQALRRHGHLGSATAARHRFPPRPLPNTRPQRGNTAARDAAEQTTHRTLLT